MSNTLTIKRMPLLTGEKMQEVYMPDSSLLSDEYYGILYKDISKMDIESESRLSNGNPLALIGHSGKGYLLLTTYHKVSYGNMYSRNMLLKEGYTKLTHKPMRMAIYTCGKCNAIYIKIGNEYFEVEHDINVRIATKSIHDCIGSHKI